MADKVEKGKKTKKKITHIERRIDFYHIRGRGVRNKDLEFDVDKFRENFAEHGDDTRVMPWGLGHSLAAWDMTEDGDDYASFKCGKASGIDFGDLIKEGKLQDWQPKAGEESVHLCHMLFFDNKYIAIEHNYKAPTANQMANYFREKAPRTFGHNFILAICKEFEEDLKKAGTLNLFEFTLSKDHLDDLRSQNPTLAETLGGAMEVYGAGVIRVELRFDKTNPGIFHDRLHSDIKKFIADKTGKTKTALKYARYRGAGDDDTGSHIVDLFKDKISNFVEIDLDARNNVDYVSAYNVIGQLFVDNEDKLSNSLALYLADLKKEEAAKKKLAKPEGDDSEEEDEEESEEDEFPF